MNKQITIVLPEHNANEPAPLYCHYEGQTQAQRAFIELDLRDGRVTVDYDGNIGGGIPEHVWNGVILRYPIRNDLTVDQIAEVIDELKDDIQYVYQHSATEFDGNGNLIGRLTNGEAKNRNELLTNPVDGIHGQDLDALVITDLADWLVSANDTSAYMPSPNDDVADYIKNFDLDGYLTTESVSDVLPELWLNKFEGSNEDNPLSPNVAKFLIDNGHCPDNHLEDMQLIANPSAEQ